MWVEWKRECFGSNPRIWLRVNSSNNENSYIDINVVGEN